MVTKPVRISEIVFDRIREEGEKLGEPSDDTTLRLVFADYDKSKIEIDKLNAENELLNKKLEEVTDERNSFQMDLNMTSLEKEREIEQLQNKLAECEKRNKK